MKMDISLTEALTGLKKAVKTLDERTLVIQTVRGKYFEYNPKTKLASIFQIHRRGDQIWRLEDGERGGNAPVQKPLREREAYHPGEKMAKAYTLTWQMSTIKTDSNLCFQFNVVFPPSLEPSVAEKLASILPPA